MDYGGTNETALEEINEGRTNGCANTNGGTNGETQRDGTMGIPMKPLWIVRSAWLGL